MHTPIIAERVIQSCSTPTTMVFLIPILPGTTRFLSLTVCRIFRRILIIRDSGALPQIKFSGNHNPLNSQFYMKKILSFSFVFVLLLLACQKEELQRIPQFTKGINFIAKVDPQFSQLNAFDLANAKVVLNTKS